MNVLLTTALRQELTSTLIRERERVTTSLQSLATARQALSASQAEEGAALGSPADVASDLADEELDLGLSEAAAVRLAAIDAALRRIAGNTYGACDRCDAPIAVDRLEALPWATECFTCASTPAPHSFRAPG